MSYIELYKKIKDNSCLWNPWPQDWEKLKNANKFKSYILYGEYSHLSEDCNAFKFLVENEIRMGNLPKHVKGKPRKDTTITSH